MPATVCVLVTDLRREPIPFAGGYVRDFLQETQLLHGETVEVLEKRGEWSFVKALNQPKRSPNGSFDGYPGWVRTSCLTLGEYAANAVVQEHLAPIYAMPSEDGLQIQQLPFGSFICAREYNRGWLQVQFVDGSIGYMMIPPLQSILEKAQYFIGSPYLWGGCSPHTSSIGSCTTSVDCSALTHLLYRSIGITIPRDARDQKLYAAPVDVLQPGDLLFRAPSATPEKIDHVMVYESGENLIEACLEAGCVRRITFEKKFGLPLQGLFSQKQTAEDFVTFGRIEDRTKLLHS